MNKQNLQTVLDLVENCSPELKNKVEKVLKKVPQSITSGNNTINYFSKSTKGLVGFDMVGRENEFTTYNNKFKGAKLSFAKNGTTQNLFICDGMYLETIKQDYNKIGVPVLQYEIALNGASKNYNFVIRHLEGGYDLSIYQQNSANYNNLAKEIKRAYLTEEEYNDIVSNQVVVIKR